MSVDACGRWAMIEPAPTINEYRLRQSVSHSHSLTHCVFVRARQFALCDRIRVEAPGSVISYRERTARGVCPSPASVHAALHFGHREGTRPAYPWVSMTARNRPLPARV